MDMHAMVNFMVNSSLHDKCAQRGNIRTNSGFNGKGVQSGLQKRATNAREELERLCIHRSHACTSLAFVVVHSSLTLASALRSSSLLLAPALPSSSLIVAHARKRLALIHALMLENVLRSSSIIVAQAGHSSTLTLENALRSSSLLLATALHSRPSSAYIGAHAIMRLALIHAHA